LEFNNNPNNNGNKTSQAPSQLTKKVGALPKREKCPEPKIAPRLKRC